MIHVLVEYPGFKVRFLHGTVILGIIFDAPDPPVSSTAILSAGWYVSLYLNNNAQKASVWRIYPPKTVFEGIIT